MPVAGAEAGLLHLVINSGGSDGSNVQLCGNTRAVQINMFSYNGNTRAVHSSCHHVSLKDVKLSSINYLYILLIAGGGDCREERVRWCY